jgi:hydrocephalus-inducing protein
MMLRGRALRPICHFELEETPSYLTRRDPGLKNELGIASPIEATDLRVVEVTSCGLRTRNRFTVYVANPTNDSYEFSWETLGQPDPAWRCVQTAGMLYAGKRIEVVFEYIAEETTVAEAFFKFRLPKVGLEQTFLFAGVVSEPRVGFSTAKVDFHSVSVGGDATETVYLENQDQLAFNFAFDRSILQQLEGRGGAKVLDIFPQSGMVAGKSKLALTLRFRPPEEAHYNFNILCDVKRKPNKLSLNIKGEGYAVHPLIHLEQTDGVSGVEKLMPLRRAPAVNYADFGAVQVLDTLTKRITVVNAGKYNFDYLWDLEGLNSQLSLGGGRMGGTLHKAEESEYVMTFSPTSECSLDGGQATFTVAGKYTYTILTRGTAVQPALRFSFMRHDFGPCFVTTPGGSPVTETAVLRLVNMDTSVNISVECLFQKTVALSVDAPPSVLEPGGVLEIPIRFAPRDVKDYAFVLPFVVNGTAKVPINIVGSGVHPKLEMANQSQRRLNFGTVEVGSTQSKTVTLVNRSKKALSVQLMEEGKYGGGDLSDRAVHFHPQHEVILAPRESLNVKIEFNPAKRVSQFNEDLVIRYAGVTKKLLAVAGRAQGVELSLDTDSLPFGTVVENSQKVKKLSFENTGDLPVTFQWLEASFGPHFSVAPLTGKLAPGTEMNFDVTFRPQTADPDIRQDNMLLAVPGMTPLSITCSGICITQPDDSKQALSFEGIARQELEQTISLDNPTDREWLISPALQGEHWSTPHEVRVPPKGSTPLRVTYFPLNMTEGKEREEDQILSGQLFIALPDGNAHLYSLTGTAKKPLSSGTVTAETPAKKGCISTIKLTNWLPVGQKFDVTIDLLEKPSAATFLSAANAVELAPNGSKEFHMRFLSFAEGKSTAKVTFTNASTGEYCYFDFEGTAVMAETLDTITLESPVRQTARYILAIENPLHAMEGESVSLSGVPPGSDASLSKDWWSCIGDESGDANTVLVTELTPLEGNAEGQFEIQYRPLLVAEAGAPLKETLLTIKTDTLGMFKYKLQTRAGLSAQKRSLHFQASLGNAHAEDFSFHAFNLAKADFAVSLRRGADSPFVVPPTLTVEGAGAGAWEGSEATVSVSFEPTAIGASRDVLVLSSATAGDYEVDLVAQCSAPLPLGPFQLSLPGAPTVEVPFRNPFTEACQWAFSTDHAAFKVGTPGASVPAKGASTVSITYSPLPQDAEGASTTAPLNAPVNGKLFVRCKDKPEIPPWVFYLRGQPGA